jgi:hypothetical protein
MHIPHIGGAPQRAALPTPHSLAQTIHSNYPQLNRKLIRLLRSPLHRLASGRFALLSVVGRKTGNVYEFPVRYFQRGSCIMFTGQKLERWWLNLAGGADVLLLIRGRQWLGTARLATDDRSVADALRALFPHSKPECIAARLPWRVAIRVTLRAESDRANLVLQSGHMAAQIES